MELLTGLLGALLGTLAGGLSAFLTHRAQLRRELEYTYDRELRARRVEAYVSLYRRTDKFPRYWPTLPARKDINSWSQSFDDWYFGEAGGLFLSNDARKAYLAMLDETAAVATGESPDIPLSDEEVQRLWRVGQALRRQLAADIGTAENPRLGGSPPMISPSPTKRFGEPS